MNGCNAVKVPGSGTFNLMPLENPCGGGIQTLQVPFPAVLPVSDPQAGANTMVNLRNYYLDLRVAAGTFDAYGNARGQGTAITFTAPTVFIYTSDNVRNPTHDDPQRHHLADPAEQRLDRAPQHHAVGHDIHRPHRRGAELRRPGGRPDDHADVDQRGRRGGAGDQRDATPVAPTCLDGTTPPTSGGAMGSTTCGPVTTSDGGYHRHRRRARHRRRDRRHGRSAHGRRRWHGRHDRHRHGRHDRHRHGRHDRHRRGWVDRHGRQRRPERQRRFDDRRGRQQGLGRGPRGPASPAAATAAFRRATHRRGPASSASSPWACCAAAAAASASRRASRASPGRRGASAPRRLCVSGARYARKACPHPDPLPQTGEGDSSKRGQAPAADCAGGHWAGRNPTTGFARNVVNSARLFDTLPPSATLEDQ